MAVSVPYRSKSSLEYLKKAEDINIKIGTLAVRMPVKYKTIYGDDMAKTGLAAYRLLQTANGIYLDKNTSELSFNSRISMMEQARGYIYNLPSVYRLCTKIRVNNERPEKSTSDKWIRQSEQLADLCSDCVDLIGGAIKSDKKRYKEYNQNGPSL